MKPSRSPLFQAATWSSRTLRMAFAVPSPSAGPRPPRLDTQTSAASRSAFITNVPRGGSALLLAPGRVRPDLERVFPQAHVIAAADQAEVALEHRGGLPTSRAGRLVTALLPVQDLERDLLARVNEPVFRDARLVVRF